MENDNWDELEEASVYIQELSFLENVITKTIKYIEPKLNILYYCIPKKGYESEWIKNGLEIPSSLETIIDKVNINNPSLFGKTLLHILRISELL